MEANPEYRWNEPMRHALTELEAFDVMRAFLEAYWKRGGKSSDDIAGLLGSINRGFLWENGMPCDPAQWLDWLDAIETVKKAKPPQP